MSNPPKALTAIDSPIDERFGTDKFLAKAMRKAFPDHWSFLLGEIAMYSFFIIVATGIFLTFFFKPSMTEVVYHGSYVPLRGVRMSEAYASTLNLSFDVRGGLLMRQIHHWSTILFLGAIVIHLLRNFFTGAFRKPRELNWLIGVVLFTLALLNGLFGYSLPDDLLSGTGLRILEGVILSLPLVGSYLMYFLFGSGGFPGEDLIPRLFAIHVLLIPGILLALIPLHAIVLTWRQTHTQFPGKGSGVRTVRGYPFYPVFIAKTTAFFLWVFGVTALLATFFQINPIWIFGPYSPEEISAGSQPDWYMGFLEGALRIMPSWEINALGHTLPMSVIVPALVVPGVLFTGLAVYPFIERWVTGDYAVHHLLDRPRDVPPRTGLGAAGVTFYGVLWAAGGNDILAKTFDVPLFWTTWFFRGAIILGPVIAYIVAYRVCLGLQRKDRGLIHHGLESGIIRRMPSGEYIEVERPVSQVMAAPITDERLPAALTLGRPEDAGVEPPEVRNPLGRLRVALNRRFVADLAEPPTRDGDGEHRAIE
ncbi:MAG TPA: ubiquinol-cytochrome c reductase cytochrome b subunit [Streptosporangiaceae bacterium]|jgi:ubiquinol-cytochrome c reductase cytochrome b subunit